MYVPLKGNSRTLPLLDNDLKPAYVSNSGDTLTCLNTLETCSTPTPRLNVWADAQRSALAKATDKTVVLKIFVNQIPETVNTDKLREKAETIMAGIENNFVTDGCQARAWAVNKKIADLLDCQPLNVLVQSPQGNLKVSKGQFKDVQWKFHIAGAVLGDDHQLHILDPLVNATHSLPAAQWLKSFEADKSIELAIAPQNGYPSTRERYIQEIDNQVENKLQSIHKRFKAIATESNPRNPRPVAPEYDWHFQLSEKSDATYRFGPSVVYDFAMQGRKIRQDTLSIVELMDCFSLKDTSDYNPDDGIDTHTPPANPLFVAQDKDGHTQSLAKDDVLLQLEFSAQKHIEITSVPYVFTKINQV